MIEKLFTLKKEKPYIIGNKCERNPTSFPPEKRDFQGNDMSQENGKGS